MDFISQQMIKKENVLTDGPGGPGAPTLSCAQVQACGNAGHLASSL